MNVFVGPRSRELNFFLFFLSNEYAFWKEKGKDDLDKINAFKTLHEVLFDFSKTMAPVLPFICEEIYQGLTNESNKSIHFENYPDADENLINTNLEKHRKSC